VAAPAVLLEQALPERAGALVGVLLGPDELRDDLGRAHRPAEPHAGEEGLREGACLEDDVGGERPKARRPVLAEGELAVSDVLDEEEALMPRELDEGLSALGREADSRRILVVRDRVQELRRQAARQDSLELVDAESVVIERDAHDLGLEALEGHHGAEVGRRLHRDGVAAIDEDLADELERLDCAAREEELLLGRPPPLEPLEPSGDEVAGPRQSLRRRVLERGRVARLDELAQDIGHNPTGERGRVRQPAGERDDVLRPREREDGDQPLPRAASSAAGEVALPAAEFLVDGHGGILSRVLVEIACLLGRGQRSVRRPKPSLGKDDEFVQ
jgi:hypothetical protein